MATIKTIKPDLGGDYTTLAAWEDWADGEASADQHAECYSGNLGTCLLTGWASTPTESVYPRVYAAAVAKHNGIAIDIVNDTFIDGQTGATAISAQIDYLRVEGIAYNGVDDGDVFFATNGNYNTVDSCLITNCFTGISFDSSDSDRTGGVAKNTIVVLATYPIGMNAVSSGVANASVSATCYHCTCICNGALNSIGFSPYAEAPAGKTATTTMANYNCFASGSADGDYLDIYGAFGGTETVSMTNNNCASVDLTADDFGGSGNLVTQTASDWFSNFGAYNLELSPGSPGRNAGTSLAGTVDTDIVGRQRGLEGSWDIGAHEYPRPAGIVST